MATQHCATNVHCRMLFPGAAAACRAATTHTFTQRPTHTEAGNARSCWPQPHQQATRKALRHPSPAPFPPGCPCCCCQGSCWGSSVCSTILVPALALSQAMCFAATADACHSLRQRLLQHLHQRLQPLKYGCQPLLHLCCKVVPGLPGCRGQPMAPAAGRLAQQLGQY